MLLRTRSTRWTWRFSLLSLVAASLMGYAIHHGFNVSTAAALTAWTAGLHVKASCLRVGLIILVAIFWPQIIRFFSRTARLSASHTSWLLMLRWRSIFWLTMVELILCQSLPARFLAVVVS